MSNDLVVYGMVDNFIESEKDEIHNCIRRWRYGLVKFTSENQDCLSMSDLVMVGKFKSFLDAMEFSLIEQFGE